jgi:predicted membrane-bound spermidine synthase
MTTRLPVSVFFALFTVSGFAGLIYQSIWSHYLKLFLGHAAYAQTLVLGIFMGGMALGSWLVSRYTDRVRHLLLGYALAELGIGLLAIVFHGVFKSLTSWAFDSVLPGLGSPAAVDLFKWLLASVLILPASVLLGTTFPLMSAGIIRAYPGNSARVLAMLYFTNSLGASIGVLASGFFLIERVGLPGTMMTAGLMNVALALFVWALLKSPAAGLGAAAAAPAPAASPHGPKALYAFILVAVAATGGASFVYEITWIRMLSLGLGSSTHAFEVMLSAFILGMSLGAFALRRRIEGITGDAGWIAGVVLAKAAFAVYAVWVYDDVLEFIRWVMVGTARTDEGYAIYNVASMVASMTVMLPTAFCAGMTLPLATRALTRRGHGEASIGRVYAANTAGCIVGATFATHVGMEWLGVKNLTGLGALLDVAVALAIVAAGMEGARRVRALAAGGAAAALCGGGFATIHLDHLRMGSGVFRYGAFADPGKEKVLFYRDGKTASIAVIDHQGGKLSIRTNGKTDAALTTRGGVRPGPDEETMVLAAALPLAMKPGAEVVANIGFGSGLTTHVLLGSPRVKEVDSIEIERMMVEGARLFGGRNRRAYEDPRSRIHIDDAKTFFAAGNRKYDVIVSEPSNPWVSGVSTLFSGEFYAEVRHHLKDDGLLVQWIQSYDINADLLSSVFKALGSRFGDYAIYRVGQSDLVVLATKGRQLPPLTDEPFRFAGVAADLAALGFRERGDLEALRISGRRAIEPLFARSAFPANSDFFPILDQRAPRSRFRGDTSVELHGIRDGLVPVLALLDGETRTPASRVRGRELVLPLRLDLARAGSESVAIALGGKASDARILPGPGRVAATLARDLAARCEGSEAEWVDALTDVVARSAPFLERGEVAAVLAKSRASPCWRSLGEVGRLRIQLLEAMNDRDPARMREHGEALLRIEDPRLEPVQRVALTAAVAGCIATGQNGQGRALWTKYGTLFPKTAHDGVQLRLLRAFVGAP